MKQIKQLKINNKLYTFNIYTEKRNSTRASITKTAITIRIPKHLSKQRQEIETQNLINWAIKKIEISPPKENIKKIYSHLDILVIYDEKYILHIENRISEKNFAKINKNRIEFKIAYHHSKDKKQEYIKKQLKKLIEKHHIGEITKRVHKINDLCFNKKIENVKIKYLTSKWGHCTSKNEVCLSTRLLLAPKAVLNYVIVHELAHLIEMNHSKKFWNIVKAVDKTYKAKEKWLKDYGHTLVI